MNNMHDGDLNTVLEKFQVIIGKFINQSKIKWIVLLEILVFFGVLILFDHFFLDGTRFYNIEPHPFWVLILLISVLYGASYGVLSALTASAVFVWGNLPGQTLSQDMYEWFFEAFKLPILWVMISMIIGKISERHITAHIELNKQLSEYTQQQATLMNSFQKIKASKEKMEIRVAGQRSTIHRVLTAARDVESLEPIQVLEKAQGLVTSMLEPDKFSIYILRNNCLQLIIENGWDELDGYSRSFSSDDKLFKSIVENQKVLYVIKPEDEIVLAGHGVLASPLIVPKTGEIFGMLKIEKQNFSKLSQNTITDLSIVCEWIGSIYGKTSRPQNIQNVVPFHAMDGKI